MVDTDQRPAFQNQVTSMIRGGGLDIEVVPAGDLTTEEMILNIGPQHPALKEPGHFEITVDGEVRRRLWDRELRRLDNLAQKTAEQFLMPLSQAEWKKPDSPNRVRDILKAALSKSKFSGTAAEVEKQLVDSGVAPDLARPLAELALQPIGANEGVFSGSLRNLLIAEGVSPTVARDLSRKAEAQAQIKEPRLPRKASRANTRKAVTVATSQRGKKR